MSDKKVEFQNFDFKPEFGNMRHIDIVEQIALYNKDRASYQEFLDKKTESVALRRKCRERKKKIREMIEFLNKKTA